MPCNKDRDRGRIAADPSHTTWYTGPHDAVLVLRYNGTRTVLKDRMIHYWGNIVEGIVWIAIAGIIHVRTRRESDEELAKIAGRTKLALFWFGISDFIEIGTGAWYRPIWLLIMKAACVTVLLHCLAKYYDLKRRKL